MAVELLFRRALPQHVSYLYLYPPGDFQ
jgi:hypothetical protein